MTLRRLAAVLVCAVALVSCAGDTGPTAPAAEPPAAGIVVRPVDGVPRPLARLLADSLVAALADKGVGARVADGSCNSGSSDSVFVVDGVVVANTGTPAAFPRHIYWRIHGPEGADLGGFVQGVQAGPWHWRNGDPRLIDGVGADAATSVVRMLRFPPVPIEAPPAPRGTATVPCRTSLAAPSPVSASPSFRMRN